LQRGLARLDVAPLSPGNRRRSRAVDRKRHARPVGSAQRAASLPLESKMKYAASAFPESDDSYGL